MIAIRNFDVLNTLCYLNSSFLTEAKAKILKSCKLFESKKIGLKLFNFAFLLTS